MKKVCIGIDVGASHIGIGIVDADMGKIILRKYFVCESSGNEKMFSKEICNAIKDILNLSNLTTDDIEKIDYDFAKQLKEDGGKYVSMVYLNGIEEPLGFLGVSFHNMNNLPSDEVIEAKMRECGGKLSELLDLKAQLKKKKGKK